VLFNEPKLLKSIKLAAGWDGTPSFSALQRAEIAEIVMCVTQKAHCGGSVSVLFNEPKLLKSKSIIPTSA